MHRTINKAGFDLIKDSEGLRLKAYPDPGTGGAPWTIGFGHTGPEVKPGLIISMDRAKELLTADLAKFERAVANLAPVATDNQFSAMVSFAFNCGIGNLEESTLLRLHRASKYGEAQAQFGKWVNAAGRKLNGLVKRRALEAALYGKPE